MEVRDGVDLGDGHLIEIGDATWDGSQTSIRNRYPTSAGGFSPRSSSEIPIGDIDPFTIALADRDLLDFLYEIGQDISEQDASADARNSHG